MENKYVHGGINKNTYNLLFSDDENFQDESLLKNSYIITYLDLYTRFREKSIFSQILKKYFENKYEIDFSKIKFNEETKEYEYSFEGEIYTFNKLSTMFDSKKIKEELESKKRYKQCHSKSLDLLLAVPKSTIVTGYLKRFDGKFLHSVLEIERKKGTYIVDYTKNIIMPKEQYFKLTDFEELERISDIEYLEDVQKIRNMSGLNTKVVLTFWKELVRDLDKNAFLLEEDEIMAKNIQKIKNDKENIIREMEKRNQEEER